MSAPLTDAQLSAIAAGNTTGYYGVPALLAEVRRQREAIERALALSNNLRLDVGERLVAIRHELRAALGES